jgi:hypothetical protein
MQSINRSQQLSQAPVRNAMVLLTECVELQIEVVHLGGQNVSFSSIWSN